MKSAKRASVEIAMLKKYRFWKTHALTFACIATGSLPTRVQFAISAESLNRFTISAKVLFSFARDSPLEREFDREKYAIAQFNQNCARHNGGIL